MISPAEGEIYIREISQIKLEDVLSKKWLQNHKNMEELNALATLQVINLEDEYVKGYFISYDKVNVLIYNLIVMECWKRWIYPKIVREKEVEKINFPLYAGLYSELILCGLTDLIIYHADGCESAEQTMPDLVDFCHRNITQIVQNCPYKEYFDELNIDEIATADKLISMSEAENLDRQAKRIEFFIGIKSISIIYSIINNLSHLPFGIRHRLLSTHDTVMLLLQLIQVLPWSVESELKAWRFDGKNWHSTNKENCQVSKIEGQVWIALVVLLTDNENIVKYEINDFKKSQLVKLLPRLTDTLLDQIPVLSHLRQFLQHLSFFNSPPAKKDLIMEQSAFIFDGIKIKYQGRWKLIAEEQTKSLNKLTQEEITEMGKLLSNLYTSDIYEEVF